MVPACTMPAQTADRSPAWVQTQRSKGQVIKIKFTVTNSAWEYCWSCFPFLLASRTRYLVPLLHPKHLFHLHCKKWITWLWLLWWVYWTQKYFPCFSRYFFQGINPWLLLSSSNDVEDTERTVKFVLLDLLLWWPHYIGLCLARESPLSSNKFAEGRNCLRKYHLVVKLNSVKVSLNSEILLQLPTVNNILSEEVSSALYDSFWNRHFTHKLIK